MEQNCKKKDGLDGISWMYSASSTTRQQNCVKTEETNLKDITVWSHDMEGHGQKCVERGCELAHKTVDQLHKVSTSCLDDNQFVKKNLEIVGELSDSRSLMMWKRLYLASIGGPHSLRTLNYLVRSVTKRNWACDLRQARLISHIHRTSNYRQYCHVGKQAIDWKLGLFQDADFAGNLTDSESTSGGVLCWDRIRLCRFHGLVRNKQLYPIAALKLKLYRLMARVTHGRHSSSEFCGTPSWNNAHARWRWIQACSSNSNPDIRNHLETVTVYFRTRDYSGCDLHYASSKTTKL